MTDKRQKSKTWFVEYTDVVDYEKVLQRAQAIESVVEYYIGDTFNNNTFVTCAYIKYSKKFYGKASMWTIDQISCSIRTTRSVKPHLDDF